jgi:stress response protein SCP2
MKLDENGVVEWQKAYGGTGRDYTSPVQQTLDGGYIVVGWTYSFGNGGVDLWLFKLDENGDIVWQKTYGGTGNEYGWFVQQTSDGGYIVVGETTSSGAGNADAWVIKLDANGNVTWQKTYGGTGDDYAYAIQQTLDLGYIVAAETNSFGAGSSDVWVFKLDANGNVTWQKTYGGTGSEFPWFTQQTQDLGYIVAAETNSFGAGQYDGWLLKLDANGNVTWQKTYGGSGNDYAWFAQQTSDGGYIVAGDSESFGQGGRDAWILKLDSSGSIGSCPFEGISTASVTDTAATVIDTSVTPITSTATTTITTATVTDTNISPKIVCSTSLGLERLKVGSSNKKNGEGTVTSREGLIACPDSCQAEYTEGFNVTLLATPSALSTFLGWKPSSLGCGGTDPCLVTMDKKNSVKAIFQGPNKLKVVTTFKNGATGTVTSSDALVNCPGDCEELYKLNAPVTLTANGSSFAKWTGKPCKDEPTNVCTFTMDKNSTVKAIFEGTP